MSEAAVPLPTADSQVGQQALAALIRTRSPLGAMEVMRREVGRVFRITLPGFRPAVFSGPETNRQLMVTDRHGLNWRSERDPVTKLLRHGVLVEDGESHDRLRGIMDPMLHRKEVLPHIPAMTDYTDAIINGWRDGEQLEMLDEMRRVALLILIGTLFGVDFRPDLERLWHPILRMLKYIAPGAWVMWPGVPRFGYGRAMAQVDDFLYRIIRDRRAEMRQKQAVPADLLTELIASDLSDALIRDQLLTMLIAGHDTSTALFAWVLYLFGTHPEAQAKARAEVDDVLGTRALIEEDLNAFPYLDSVIHEALRMFPPIHVGNRQAKEDMCVGGYQVPGDTRVMVSIYLSHRDPEVWENPEAFCPERFERGQRRPYPAFGYIPFGGGPRNCIGAAYALIEARVVLSRLLQQFEFELLDPNVRKYMGATLEPRPGVLMKVTRR